MFVCWNAPGGVNWQYRMDTTPKEQVRCSKCGSTDVRYSYTQTTWDLILDLLFSMDAFRCRSCRRRFHKFDPGGQEDEESEPRKGRKKRTSREDDVSQQD
jgi:hypothetical protein